MKRLRRFYNLYLSPNKKFAQHIYKLTGFAPANLSIYKLAFKHSSKAQHIYSNNERLEFLGDAVLGAIISEYLFKKYPIKDEGFLTEMRAKIVKRKKLGEIGEKLALKQLLDYDHSYVTVSNTLLGNALEAFVGAIYLDSGYKTAKTFVLQRIIVPHINLDALQTGDINFKSRLLEWSQKHGRELLFKVLEEKSHAGQRLFHVGLYIDQELVAKGEGKSKKDAQTEAAKIAYEQFKIGQDLEREQG